MEDGVNELKWADRKRSVDIIHFSLVCLKPACWFVSVSEAFQPQSLLAAC